jgi:hypothetical protein
VCPQIDEIGRTLVEALNFHRVGLIASVLPAKPKGRKLHHHFVLNILRYIGKHSTRGDISLRARSRKPACRIAVFG